MGIIYCCPIYLGGEISNWLSTLPLFPIFLSPPHSLSPCLSLVDAKFLTPEAPLAAKKAPCMYNGYINSKDDVHSPFVKPPWAYSCQFAEVCESHYYPLVFWLCTNFFNKK
jgi:hypothetical protein